jgi:hypothetical protein
MAVNPDAREILGFSAEIDLLVKEFRHGLIIQGDGDNGTDLANEHKVLHQQEVIGRRDSKSADFGVTQIPQEEKLGPGCR